MQLALARHDALLRDAIESHRGFVLKTTGDGFHAAFSTAHDAVDAAVQAQLALAAEPWDRTGPLRVRMGLHTARGSSATATTTAAAVNRTARLNGDPPNTVAALDITSEILLDFGRSDAAAIVVGYVDGPASVVNLMRHSVRDHGELCEELRRVLGDTRYDELTSTGADMSADAVVAVAIEALDAIEQGAVATA